jgi:hypothetical protein
MANVLYDSLDNKELSIALWSVTLDDTALNRTKVTYINRGNKPHFLFANTYSAEDDTASGADGRVQVSQQSISFTLASQSGWFRVAGNAASTTILVSAFF